MKKTRWRIPRFKSGVERSLKHFCRVTLLGKNAERLFLQKVTLLQKCFKLRSTLDLKRGIRHLGFFHNSTEGFSKKKITLENFLSILYALPLIWIIRNTFIYIYVCYTYYNRKDLFLYYNISFFFAIQSNKIIITYYILLLLKRGLVGF